MTIRSGVLFTPTRKASPLLIKQTVFKGAAQPLGYAAALIEEDRSATLFFRGWWGRAFPSRDPLPYGPIAERDGRGTDGFWTVFA